MLAHSITAAGTKIVDLNSVTLEPGETDDSNNFIDSTKWVVIIGSVMNAQGEPLIGVTIKLFDSDETLFAMTTFDHAAHV